MSSLYMEKDCPGSRVENGEQGATREENQLEGFWSERCNDPDYDGARMKTEVEGF